MAQASHPNILTVFDFGEFEGRPYLVMEHVERGDLRRVMVPGEPMDPSRVEDLARQLGRALDCLHRHGILHLDLKPENILLHEEGLPKVIDFGIAARHASRTMSRPLSSATGTIGYVAPEQRYGLELDERADQYSLAALTYELLTGHQPLGVIARPSELSPRLSPEIDVVLLRGLQEDPADRYPSIKDFTTALGSSLGRIDHRRRPLGTRRLAAALVLLMMPVAVATWFDARLRWSTLFSVQEETGLVAPRPESPASRDSAATVQRSIPLRRSIRNSLGMTLLYMPAGSYVMGSPDTDPAAEDIEKPQQLVRIHEPFYLATHEVAVGQFRRFVEATGYVTQAESRDDPGGDYYNKVSQRTERSPRLSWRIPGFEAGLQEDQPVVQVSWHDARAFLDWLSTEEGTTYRLPTEVEWEYACRAGRTTRWSFGDHHDELRQYAWFQDNSSGGPQPIGTRQPNPAGLLDMHGNVWEWCLNRFTEPDQDAAAALASPAHVLRPIRGGGWHWTAAKTRSASRASKRPDDRFYGIGFRVCRSIQDSDSWDAS